MSALLPTAAISALVLAACGAAPNPGPSNEPAPWVAPEKSAGPSAPTAPAASAQQDKPAAGAPAKPESAGASAPTPAASAKPVTPPSSGLVIANVAGKPLDASELIAQWVHHKSSEALDELDHLVLTRLVGAEAGRLGVEIAPDVAEAAYAAAVAEMEKEINKRWPGTKLDTWIDRVQGLDPYVYRERMRADALNQLVAERVTRAHVLTSEHALTRLIVVKSADVLKQVQDALAAGEDFAAVARRLSADPSAKDGGRVAPVLRADTPMGKLAFTTAIGAVSEPLYNEGAWLIAKIEARPTPLEGNWPQIRAAVEQSLIDRGIEDLEFTQWRATMLKRYQVDIAPFLRLAGQPLR